MGKNTAIMLGVCALIVFGSCTAFFSQENTSQQSHQD